MITIGNSQSQFSHNGACSNSPAAVFRGHLHGLVVLVVQQQQSSGEALAAVAVVCKELEIHRDRGAIAAVTRRCHKGLFSLEAEGQEVALLNQCVAVPLHSVDMGVPITSTIRWISRWTCRSAGVLNPVVADIFWCGDRHLSRHRCRSFHRVVNDCAHLGVSSLDAGARNAGVHGWSDFYLVVYIRAIDEFDGVLIGHVVRNAVHIVLPTRDVQTVSVPPTRI